MVQGLLADEIEAGVTALAQALTRRPLPRTAMAP